MGDSVSAVVAEGARVKAGDLVVVQLVEADGIGPDREMDGVVCRVDARGRVIVSLRLPSGLEVVAPFTPDRVRRRGDA